MAFAPNLTDDDWLYGGTHDKIQAIHHQRPHGYHAGQGRC